MGIDQRLIDLLCCPVSKVAVTPLSAARLAYLNQRIAAGEALAVTGSKLSTPLDAGLITTDGKVIYRVDDGIPVMLPEEGIGTTQFQDFPH
jgi:uncharacterized protein YbaR (Trm112 family)